MGQAGGGTAQPLLPGQVQIPPRGVTQSEPAGQLAQSPSGAHWLTLGSTFTSPMRMQNGPSASRMQTPLGFSGQGTNEGFWGSVKQ